MTRVSSNRTILRSPFIMSAASVINILFSLIKMKAAALLAGPAVLGFGGRCSVERFCSRRLGEGRSGGRAAGSPIMCCVNPGEPAK